MNPRFLLHSLLRVLLMLAMAGCSHMPVTSMVKLARVDFETSDPAQLRAPRVKLNVPPGGPVPHRSNNLVNGGQERSRNFSTGRAV